MRAVEDAAMKYALENSAFTKVRVTVIKIVGDYAKVSITPLSEPGDIGTAYLQKVNGSVGRD